MIDQLTRLSAIERLELYLDFIKNRKKYSPEEQCRIEEYFEDG
jgi:hypothetical protein